MKKSIVVLSAIAALSTTSFAADVSNEAMLKQIEMLKAQIAALESKFEKTEKAVSDERFTKLEKQVQSNKNLALGAKKQSASDNIKWDIDFRTQIDNISYKTTDGSNPKNNALLTNRLWLGAAYAPNDNTVFKGKLSYNKVWGDTANHSQSNTGMGVGYADFDWVTNENAVDNEMKVKEAYWLYKDNTIGEAQIPWTVSVGRRPSTDGLPINMRNMQKANSPLSHVVDVEFDGFSAKFDLEKVTGATGSWFKICGGRGLSNANPRFTMNGTDYARNENLNVDVDMLGFIAVPYDDGQYSVHLNYAHAWNLIGYDGMQMGQYNAAPKTTPSEIMDAYAYLQFKDVGDMDYATILLKAYGIGDGISDYLDDTTVFASYAMSKTNPNNSNDLYGMLGSGESETGHSYWIGINAPCPISPNSARIGVEWNKGSKYWRSMTYGEDTFAGSKIATRGTAWEIYRNQKINNALSWGMSYTHMDYDYSGSNSFFGYEGNPDNPMYVTEATDIKAYVRYKF
ncbi:DUF3373 family protein [Arcobacter arenosus]|uniref:DUF3373 family protein n=1 Tax=Arcobacter arenosus TaxID=2576037 RepID=UPI003BABE083